MQLQGTFFFSVVLVISCVGLFMQALFKPDIVGVKLFILGFTGFSPAAVPHSFLFVLHFSLVLVLAPLPAHAHLHGPAGDDGGQEAGAGTSPGDP